MDFIQCILYIRTNLVTQPHSGVNQTVYRSNLQEHTIKKEMRGNKDIYKEDGHAAAEQRRNVKPIDSVTMEGFGFTECALFTL